MFVCVILKWTLGSPLPNLELPISLFPWVSFLGPDTFLPFDWRDDCYTEVFSFSFFFLFCCCCCNFPFGFLYRFIYHLFLLVFKNLHRYNFIFLLLNNWFVRFIHRNILWYLKCKVGTKISGPYLLAKSVF